MTAKYCIDTSSLIHAWRRAYNPKNIVSFWAKLENAISIGDIVATKEVLTELKKKDDDVHKWANGRPKHFWVEIDDAIQQRVVGLMTAYPRLVDTAKGRSGCDPFVIATAGTYAPCLTVISEEGRGKRESPRIPDVCRLEKIPCVNLFDFIAEVNWTI